MRASTAAAVRQKGMKKECASCPSNAAAALRSAGIRAAAARQLPRNRAIAASTALRVGSQAVVWAARGAAARGAAGRAALPAVGAVPSGGACVRL